MTPPHVGAVAAVTEVAEEVFAEALLVFAAAVLLFAAGPFVAVDTALPGEEDITARLSRGRRSGEVSTARRSERPQLALTVITAAATIPTAIRTLTEIRFARSSIPTDRTASARRRQS
jgi:hypothetical protein